MDKREESTTKQTQAGPGPWAGQIRALSDRLVLAQKPIRILDAIKWPHAIEQQFLERQGQELPSLEPEYYQQRPLPFDPAAKRQEFQAIEKDIRKVLGDTQGPGPIMLRMCREYQAVVRMLAARGTPEFGIISRQLYGSVADAAESGTLPLASFPAGVRSWQGTGPSDHPPRERCTLHASQAVAALSERLAGYFQDAQAVRVRLADGIVADAAAGSDYLKIRRDACFNWRDIRLLEVHEGWVHLGTTLNGQRQPVCTFLGKGAPSSTLTQEGLAVMTEVLSGAAHPERLRRLGNRVEALRRAEAGADFRDIYRFFRDEGYAPADSYQQTVRIFRGSLPAGCLPFTKDLCYVKGFLLVQQFLQQLSAAERRSWIPLLFCGKTTLADIPSLACMVEDGLVLPPRFLPPPFASLASQQAA